MGILRDEAKKLSGSLRQRTAEPELDEEIQFHLDMQTEKNVRLGMSPEEARRAALVRFGGTERIKEEARDEYRSRPLEDFVQDLRYGVRSALARPAVHAARRAHARPRHRRQRRRLRRGEIGAARRAPLRRRRPPGARLRAELDGTLERSGVSAGAVGDFTARQRSFTRLAAFFNGTVDATYNSETGPRVLQADAGRGRLLPDPRRDRAALGRTLSRRRLRDRRPA